MAEASTNRAQHRQLLDMTNNQVDPYEAMKTVVGDLRTNATALQTEAHRVANESTATKSEAERRYDEKWSRN